MTARNDDLARFAASAACSRPCANSASARARIRSASACRRSVMSSKVATQPDCIGRCEISITCALANSAIMRPPRPRAMPFCSVPHMSLTETAISDLTWRSDMASANESPPATILGEMPNMPQNWSFQMMMRPDASTMQSACDMLLRAASRHRRETVVR